MTDLNTEFVSAFRRHRVAQVNRKGHPISAATVNRDLAALGSFLSWCTKTRGIAVERPSLAYYKEPRGRMRWLSKEEVAALEAKCSPEWWPLFSLMLATGMTIGEALGLRRADIDLNTRRVSIHEEYGRTLKRASRARELSVPQPLVVTLASWLEGMEQSPVAMVFPFTYWPARKAWIRACKAANIFGATIHDARHTFAVHYVQSGGPEARLQKILGHSHAATTRRYASHSPEQFLDADADRVAQHMGMATPALKLQKQA